METTEKKEALRREKLSSDYKIQKWVVRSRRAVFTADKLLDEYEKKYLLISLMVGDPLAAEFADFTPISGEDARSWCKLGYNRALADIFSIFAYERGGLHGEIADRYASLIDEFENNIPEEE